METIGSRGSGATGYHEELGTGLSGDIITPNRLELGAINLKTVRLW